MSRTRWVRTSGDDYGVSQQPRELAKENSSVRRFDGEELVGLILEHYEDLVPVTKAPISRPVRYKRASEVCKTSFPSSTPIRCCNHSCINALKFLSDE